MQQKLFDSIPGFDSFAAARARVSPKLQALYPCILNRYPEELNIVIFAKCSVHSVLTRQYFFCIIIRRLLN